MGWEGPERRSAESLLARAIAAAKREADELKDELGATPAWQLAQRRELKRQLKQAQRREADALFTLRGR
jgi:hypothetical protein